MLGAMLLHAAAAKLACDLATADLFFRQAHRQIFAAIVKVVESGSEADLVTVKHALGADLDEAGGPAYISALLDGLPHSTNIEHHIRILREMKMRRDVIAYASEVMSQAYAGEDESQVVIANADAHLSRLMGVSAVDDLVPQSEAMGEYLNHLEHRIANKHTLLGLSTGFPTLDDVTCGLEPGHASVLAGATGGGKTAIALNIAAYASESLIYSDGCVVYASLEMSKQELQSRMLANYANVELFKIRKGWLSLREQEAVGNAMARMTTWPFYVDDTPVMTVRGLRARCRRLAAKVPVRLLVVDYMQLVTPDPSDERESRATAVGNIGRGLKLLARELNCHVMELSQLTKEPGKQKRRPNEGDLRESGAIAQHASNIYFVWKEDPEVLEGVTELIVGKQRNGRAPATVDFYFDKPVQRFVDQAAQEAQTVEPVQASLDVEA